MYPDGVPRDEPGRSQQEKLVALAVCKSHRPEQSQTFAAEVKVILGLPDHQYKAGVLGLSLMEQPSGGWLQSQAG